MKPRSEKSPIFEPVHPLERRGLYRFDTAPQTNFTEHPEAQSFSPRTVEAYTRHAVEFASFRERHCRRVTRPNEVTRDIVDDYQRFVQDAKTRDGRPPANATVRLKLTAVKILFAFLAKQDLVLRDPTTVIVAPKEEQ